MRFLAALLMTAGLLSGGVRIVLVGDVSGKGLKAAMLVSVAVGILRNEKSSSPAAILGALLLSLVVVTSGVARRSR